MIPSVLEVCWQKLILPETESQTLTRSLFNVFLAATLQDVNKTFSFLESKGLVLDFLLELIDAGQLEEDETIRVPRCSLSSHKSAYELKLYALGLTHILFVDNPLNSSLQV